jgi:DNA-binding response OmpR family regulator
MSSRRILVVETNEFSRRNVALFFMQHGYRPFEADSAQKAFELLAREDFYAVITDFSLEGKVTGLDILRRYDQVSPGGRKILVSDAREYAQSDGAHCLQKPLSLGDLLLALKNHNSAGKDH